MTVPPLPCAIAPQLIIPNVGPASDGVRASSSNFAQTAAVSFGSSGPYHTLA